MILLFPIASSDRTHAQAFLKLLQKFGPYPEDKALILPTPSAYYDPVLRPIVDGIQALFNHEQCRVELTGNDFGSTWPYAPGCHFKFGMEMIDQLGWNEPSIWMEPDFMPIKPGWLKAVKDDYQMAATPFRGMLERTRYIDTTLQRQPDGTLKAIGRSPRYDGTIHLVGAGIYPALYIQYLTPSKNGEKGSPMASFRNPSNSIPFDVKCQDQHVPATQSPLMVHKPRTVNWKRISGNTFTCEDRAKDEFGLTYAGTVNLDGIYLVHGCKDDSLADAILQADPQLDLSFPEPNVKGKAPEKEAEPVSDILIDRLESLMEQNAMLQEQCQFLSQKLQELSKPQTETKQEPVVSQVPEKRKPGRPKGSGKVKAAAAA